MGSRALMEALGSAVSGTSKHQKMKLDALRRLVLFPSDYERISCAKRFFSGAGVTERSKSVTRSARSHALRLVGFDRVSGRIGLVEQLVTDSHTNLKVPITMSRARSWSASF
jgi:hypothetical protein